MGLVTSVLTAARAWGVVREKFKNQHSGNTQDSTSNAQGTFKIQQSTLREASKSKTQ
jgi:hypothetical protein